MDILNSQATATLVSAWERSLGGEVNLETETKNDLGLEFTPLRGAVEKFERLASGLVRKKMGVSHKKCWAPMH